MNAETWVAVGTFLAVGATVWLGFETRQLGRQSAKALEAQNRPLVVLEEPEQLLGPGFLHPGTEVRYVGGFPGMFCEGREEATGRILFSIVVDLVNHGTGPALNLTVYLVYNNRNSEKVWQPIPGIVMRMVGAKSLHDRYPYLNAFEVMEINEMPMLLGYGLEYQNSANVHYWTEALIGDGDPLGRIQKVEVGEGEKASQHKAFDRSFYPSERESVVHQWIQLRNSIQKSEI